MPGEFNIDSIAQLFKSMPQETQTQLASKFLPMFTGTVTPMRKPEYTDNIPPVYLDRVQICRRDEGDRFYTEIKVWIKPPSFKFSKTGSFISFSNGKSNVFSRMTVKDLVSLKIWLDVQIPIIEAKLKEMEPLEANQEAAKRAYDAIVNNSENQEE